MRKKEQMEKVHKNMNEEIQGSQKIQGGEMWETLGDMRYEVKSKEYGDTGRERSRTVTEDLSGSPN